MFCLVVYPRQLISNKLKMTTTLYNGVFVLELSIVHGIGFPSRFLRSMHLEYLVHNARRTRPLSRIDLEILVCGYGSDSILLYTHVYSTSALGRSQNGL